MKVFNLSKQLNTVEAMGAEHMFGRDPYEWWDYESLVSQGDQRFSDYMEDDPSLQRVLREAGDRRQKYIRDIRQVYGIDVGQATNIFKTYIGYGPAESYIVNVGPYFSKGYVWGPGHQRASAIDKFAYYVLRKGKYTQEETNKALVKLMRKYVNAYGIDLEPSDFKFVVRNPADFNPEKKKQENRTILEEVSDLGTTPLLPNPQNDPEIEARNEAIRQQNISNNPSGVDFFLRSPVVGEGSTLEPNSSGYGKLMRGLMGPWYEEVITEKAATKVRDEGVNIQDAREAVIREYLNDFGEVEEIYKAVYRKYEDAVRRGDPEAIGMNPPPKFRSAPLKGKAGAQQFTSCPDIELVRSLLGVRKHIVELMQRGVDDPTQILESINTGRTPKKRFKIENVMDEIDKINSIRHDLESEGSPDAANLSNYIDGQISEINEKIDGEKAAKTERGDISGKDTVYGFSDLRTAFEMASLYLPGFNPPSNFDNYTSEDLVRFAKEKTQKDIDAEEATEKDISEEIGESVEMEKTPLEEPVTPLQAPITDQPIVQDVDEEEELLDLLSSTLKNLIRVANELDDDGKGDAAEEVHKVIRKYQGEIK